MENVKEMSREELQERYGSFVCSVAKLYRNQGLSMPELIAAGNVGLFKATETFDESRGFRFISYAIWFVRESINRTLPEFKGYIPSAKEVMQKSCLIAPREKVILLLVREVGSDAQALQEIADLLDLTANRVRQIFERALRKCYYCHEES